MKYIYPFNDHINLFVEGRIPSEDAERQMRTAKEILVRLERQPGLVLADEVGMGKTFVALAIAVSVATGDSEKRPVVIMVPSALKEKWPRDFDVFKTRCLPRDTADSLRAEKVETAVDFLKLLDDPIERRRSIVFLTHGAMSRGLTDESGMWIKLALVQRAFHHRKEIQNLKRAFYRVAPQILKVSRMERYGEEFWEKLIEADPSKWKKALIKYGYEINDDPVPQSIMDVLYGIDTSSLFNELRQIPHRESKNIDERIRTTRHVLYREMKDVWNKCLANIKIQLPLLILDEAHHLKNPDTLLAGLFRSREAQADVEQVKVHLSGTFERMLFLTATPFQLGHYELCSVLERFEGISWSNDRAPDGGLEKFKSEIKELKDSLDKAQESAVRLDYDWQKLTSEDLKAIPGNATASIDWLIGEPASQFPATSNLASVVQSFRKTRERMKMAEELLRKWVIRHLRTKFITQDDIRVARREQFIGRSIANDELINQSDGLEIEGPSLLPFLLSARLASLNPEARPIFSEGLASSYQAFLYTRNKKEMDACTDLDDDESNLDLVNDPAVEWYMGELSRSLPDQISSNYSQHPKIKATVEKVIDMWLRGEKVLVFCHYVVTGRILRQYISGAMRVKIESLGAERLHCPEDQVMNQLDAIGKKFFDQDSRLRVKVDKMLASLIEGYPVLEPYKDQLIDVTRRYLRTPTFLVRYFPLAKETLDESDYQSLFKVGDASGMSLEGLLLQFLDFLQRYCADQEREGFLKALESIQTGSFMSSDLEKLYSEDELQGDRSEKLMPNVRLINGTTKQESRQKLMLTFNTPFYPDVLIASSVMAEGVDLHLNCRYVIHHDLCWNPSTLEQRTGRVDRIGAKVEKCLKPIHVYFPFISETQDEKMYRVVMDRERWFKVVMGEKYKCDLKTTEKLASRIPFPEEAALELMFKLGV